MKILEVKRLHRKGGAWIVPVVRKTRKGKIMQLFKHGYYQSAKRQWKKFLDLLINHDGIYTPKKKL